MVKGGEGVQLEWFVSQKRRRVLFFLGEGGVNLAGGLTCALRRWDKKPNYMRCRESIFIGLKDETRNVRSVRKQYWRSSDIMG